nr:kinesin-like protein Nod [Onthophagus taurus]
MDNTLEFVNVAVRIRPQSIQDSANGCNLKVISNNPPILTVSDRQHFNLDHIFDGDSSQIDVFNEIVRPMIDKLLKGFDCTVFAYGQTGTGKTYTMGYPQMDEENMGMINRTFKEIFQQINNEMEIYTEVSLYEIYNEKVFDLLDDHKVALSVKGFQVPDLKRVPVYDLAEAQQLFSIASKNRRTGGTLQNSKSSRSHAIYTLYCKISNGGSVTCSKFNFVDLAGSESIRKTGSAGNCFHEGININKGLLCLGQVINALSSNQNYVPYRQAMITTLLKDSLCKKNFITLIACVSSKLTDTTETLQTLDFAKRVKRIGNKPEAFSMINTSIKKSSQYLTPMKAFGPIQTSTALKKPIRVPLPPKFTYNLDNVEDQAINISPIVRRCVAEIESKLVSTINNLMKTQTPLRRSTRISSFHRKYDDYSDENQQSCLKQFKSDDSKSVPLKTITNKSNNPTSAMEKIIFDDLKQNNEDIKNSSSPNIFKVPLLPNTMKTRNASKLKKTSSPNTTNEYNEFAKTLSTDNQFESRLSMESSEITTSNISSIMSVSLRKSTRIKRQTVRLTVGDVHKSNKKSVNKTNKSRKGVSDRSMKVIKKQKVENHCDHILEILNEGSLKAVMTLHTIGVKTAEQILLFRKLRGNFKTIEDIKNVLHKGKSYQRFLEANFLI